MSKMCCPNRQTCGKRKQNFQLTGEWPGTRNLVVDGGSVQVEFDSGVLQD